MVSAGRNGTDRVSGLSAGHREEFQQVPGHECCLCCMAPRPAAIWAGVPEHESLIKEAVGSVGSGLVRSHLKGILPGMLFAVSRNGLALAGAVLLGSARHHDVKAS